MYFRNKHFRRKKDLNLLIPAVIAQIFNPTAELTMTIRITTKEAKAEMETHPLTAEAKISKVLM